MLCNPRTLASSQYHGRRDILEDYCRVEVSTVIQGYENDMLDNLNPKRIEKLGKAIKNFILWPLCPRRDVQLSEPPPSSQATSLTQESLLADHVANEPSSPADPLSNPLPSPTQSLPNLPSSSIVPALDNPSSPNSLSLPLASPFNYSPSPPPKDIEQTSELMQFIIIYGTQRSPFNYSPKKRNLRYQNWFPPAGYRSKKTGLLT